MNDLQRQYDAIMQQIEQIDREFDLWHTTMRRRITALGETYRWLGEEIESINRTLGESRVQTMYGLTPEEERRHWAAVDALKAAP